jgi:enoyl-CoA hydratase/carnithine racemase
MVVVTLNRPESRNPLDPELSSELLGAVRDAMVDDAVRSVAIAAEGSAFSAGGDLRQMRHLAASPAPAAHGWPSAIVELHQLALQAPKPLVALVDGPAYAGGMGLAGICDVVLATPRASFALPEVRIGLFPMIVVAHLARSLPRKVLLEMMMTGQPLSVDDAHRLGFVARICPDAEALQAQADRYAGWFADAAPDAIRLGRKAFAVLADLPAPQALDAAQLFNLAFFLGDALPEGAGAFLEKRPPAWVDDDG